MKDISITETQKDTRKFLTDEEFISFKEKKSMNVSTIEPKAIKEDGTKNWQYRCNYELAKQVPIYTIIKEVF